MKQYGFIPEPIVIGDHYFGGAYGSLEGDDINPSGNWRLHVPIFEPQNIAGVETYACTLFGTTNCVETLGKFQYGIELNLSDRFLAKASGLGDTGGSPHTAAEWVRKVGAPEEAAWPFSPDIVTREQYMAALPPKLFDLARAYFHNPWDFRHEWVGTDTATRKKYLKKSPLGRSVYAWTKDPKTGLYYRPEGVPENHWVEEVFIQDGGYEHENYALIFDSYNENGEPFKKYRLADLPLQAKRYQLNKRDPRDLEIPARMLDALLKSGLGKFFSTWFARFWDASQLPTVPQDAPKPLPPPPLPTLAERLAQTAIDALGTKPRPPGNKVPDNLACVVAAVTVAGPVIELDPTLAYTPTFEQVLAKDKVRFTNTRVPKKGCFIVSSTKSDLKRGHCGIFISDTEIASNNSKTGLWEQNYTITSWLRDFKTKKGLTVLIFEPVDNV